MAIRIQIRRDTAANWTSTNAVLYPGEIGIETDTKKFKFGPTVVSPTVATAWNSIASYANVVPSDLSGTLADYIEVADLGNPDGPAKLDVNGNLLIPENSIIFEGATADAYELTLLSPDVTADKTVTLPNATTTLIGTDTTDTLTNKTLTSPKFNENVALTSTSTQLNYVNGVTSAIQTQIDTKAPIASPTFTGTVSGITKTMVGLGSVDNTTDANKPVSTATQTALDLKAPLADPTFTGTVSGVTKTHVGLGNVDNTADASKPVSTAQATAIATAKSEAIADATARVNAVIASAPAALDTLDELAAALGDDANYAATITTALAGKVPSATTISQKTASYTLASINEKDSMIEMNAAGATTVTVPTDAAVAFPVGTSLDILRVGAGAVDVAAAGGVTVNATPGLKLRSQWSSATLIKRAANTWVLVGDLSA